MTLPYKVEIRDEGVSKGVTRAIDFTGAGVTASVSNDTATVNIPASAGPAGADGARGLPGADGEDGADGVHGNAAFAPDFRASGAASMRGLVPDPGAVAGTAKFLREDASWSSPTATVALNADGGVWPYGVLDAGVINNDSFDGGGP